MQSLIQKGFEMETIHAVLNEMDFTQMKEAVLDDLLQRDLEKIIIKNRKIHATEINFKNYRRPYEKRI